MNVTRTVSICTLMGLMVALFNPNFHLNAGKVQEISTTTKTGFDAFGLPLRKHGLDLIGAGIRRMLFTEAYAVGLYSTKRKSTKTIVASNLATTIANATGRLFGPDSVLCLKFHRPMTTENL